jgi:hypothetical protein
MPLNVSVVDTFTRVDAGNLGPNYIFSTGVMDNGSDPLKLVGNQFSAEYHGEQSYTAATLNTDDGHLEVAYTVQAVPVALGKMRLGFVSVANSQSGYEAEWAVDTSVMTLMRSDAGSRTTLGTVGSVTWVAGDLFIVRRLATGHISVVKDHAGTETVLLDVADSTYAGEFYGYLSARNDGGGHEFRGDNFAAGAYNPDFISFTLRLSGGAANADPALSLGGAESSVAAVGTTLLSDETNLTRVAGRTRYRCLYHHNQDATRTAAVIAWIDSSSIPSGVTVALGAAAEGAGSTAAAISGETVAPSGVTFSSPTTSGTAISLGNVAPGALTGLWIREVRGANTVTSPTGEVADVTVAVKLRATPL